MKVVAVSFLSPVGFKPCSSRQTSVNRPSAVTQDYLLDNPIVSPNLFVFAIVPVTTAVAPLLILLKKLILAVIWLLHLHELGMDVVEQVATRDCAPRLRLWRQVRIGDQLTQEVSRQVHTITLYAHSRPKVPSDCRGYRYTPRSTTAWLFHWRAREGEP